jgi:hypothetical protein
MPELAFVVRLLSGPRLQASPHVILLLSILSPYIISCWIQSISNLICSTSELLLARMIDSPGRVHHGSWCLLIGWFAGLLVMNEASLTAALTVAASGLSVPKDNTRMKSCS